MGFPIVERVITTLSNSGIRAAAAWPGEKIPYLTAPAAAVCLEEADSSSMKTTVLVTVYAPGNGESCEAAAAVAMEALQKDGGTCRLESCRYNGQLDLFTMALHVLYDGVGETAGEALPISVQIGAAALDYLTGFKSWHLTDEPKTVPLSSAVCYFRVEEFIPSGEAEQNTPQEPFTMVVIRGGTTETFTGCYLTSDVREDRVKGVCRVRSGTAEKKTYVSIL